MEENEFKTERRISNMMMENGNFNSEDRRKMYYAYKELEVLRKSVSELIQKAAEQTFELKKEEYMGKMKWINDFVKSKGIDEQLFTDLLSYKTSVDDYDYFYELKTPTQYKKEEEQRKAKKLAKSEGTTEKKFPEEPNI